MAISRSSSTLFFTFLLFSVFINPTISSRTSSFIKPVTVHSRSSVAYYCESWRLAAETENAGIWKVVPSKCVTSLEKYYNGGQFDSDYNIVASYALAFARTAKIGQDGKDAWVLDIDETLLSNLPYYKTNGYGSKPFNSESFNEWVVKGKSPGYDASLKLYKGLKKLGFTIILLTGRDEAQRNITEKNLRDAGYYGWERLLLRGRKDQGKKATQYKSEQRAKLIKEGFKLHGNTGDQWSDLQGFAVADRSFKETRVPKEKVETGYESCLASKDPLLFNEGTLFVGFDLYLPTDVIKSVLIDYFGSCGEVTRVFVPLECGTIFSKSYALIDLQNNYSDALKLNRSYMGNWKLEVKMAYETYKYPCEKKCSYCKQLNIEGHIPG